MTGAMASSVNPKIKCRRTEKVGGIERICLWSGAVVLYCLCAICCVAVVTLYRRIEDIETRFNKCQCRRHHTNTESSKLLQVLGLPLTISKTQNEKSTLDFSRRFRFARDFSKILKRRTSAYRIEKPNEQHMEASRIKRDVDENPEVSNVMKTHTDKTTERGIRHAMRTSTSLNLDLYAAHFVSKLEKDDFQGRKVGLNCIPKWEGTFCRNSTYWSPNANQDVQFFTQSEWMNKSPDDLSMVQVSPGRFQALHSGLYLLYLNMMIQVTLARHDVAVNQGSRRLLNCEEGLDIVRSNGGDPFKWSQPRTCSVSGVFYLTKGQELTVNIVTPKTAIVLESDSTNFGALLFSGNSIVEHPVDGVDLFG